MELLTGSDPPFNSIPGQPDQCYKNLDTGVICKHYPIIDFCGFLQLHR